MYLTFLLVGLYLVEKNMLLIFFLFYSLYFRMTPESQIPLSSEEKEQMYNQKIEELANIDAEHQTLLVELLLKKEISPQEYVDAQREWAEQRSQLLAEINKNKKNMSLKEYEDNLFSKKDLVHTLSSADNN